MKKVRQKVKRVIHAASVPWLLLSILLFLGYNIVGNWASSLEEVHDISMAVDHRIGLVPAFVLPYLFAYISPFLLIGFLTFFKKASQLEIARVSLALVLMILTSYAIYILFPTTAMAILPDLEAHPGSGVIMDLLNLTYNKISHYNAFPSFHVASQFYILLVLWHFSRKLFWAFLPIFVGIAVATVTLRFHYVLDIPGGMAMGAIGYYVYYRKVAYRLMKKNLRERLRGWRPWLRLRHA